MHCIYDEWQVAFYEVGECNNKRGSVLGEPQELCLEGTFSGTLNLGKEYSGKI